MPDASFLEERYPARPAALRGAWRKSLASGIPRLRPPAA